MAKEINLLRFLRKSKAPAAAVLIVSFLFLSCNSNTPKPIKLNSDHCDYCKMTISNAKFSGEVITEKGRYYKFDDIGCMVNYIKENTSVTYTAFFITDYLQDDLLIPAASGFYIKGGSISSPMGGNVAAFKDQAAANEYGKKLGASMTTWETISNASN